MMEHLAFHRRTSTHLFPMRLMAHTCPLDTPSTPRPPLPASTTPGSIRSVHTGSIAQYTIVYYPYPNTPSTPSPASTTPGSIRSVHTGSTAQYTIVYYPTLPPHQVLLSQHLPHPATSDLCTHAGSTAQYTIAHTVYIHGCICTVCSVL